ncbi:hypothetical protein IMG5_193590 [Ichthyophthirius multifiliis]|uniref:Uncharacterized protein n=1 Tax=Ichthyophthirius multifiliis TaxID=5932 RepID=G0R4K8_ICHMU|nr:hypothetical protein IMG5_193590 [Ichthyophthirius multifiliis]EGR27606.1 hypothetical protein IMG5_193590 [Ichthyophthirius multifiliis]|eukprot:XP_004025058.1 hypothetical protein IMG5_193590 [Ichthyophthirius multifiliis]
MEAVNTTDQISGFLMNEMSEKSTLLVFSDHGQLLNGNHGGNSTEEIETIIYGYNKKGFIKQQKMDISQLMDVIYLNSTTDQLDITATICMLKGCPIPRNNLGIIISDFFLDLEQNSQAVIANAFYTNFRQVEDQVRDIQDFMHNLNENTFNELMEMAKNIKNKYKRLFTTGIKYKNSYQLNPLKLKQFIGQIQNFGYKVKSIFRNEGQTPNLVYIKYGVIIWNIAFSNNQNLRIHIKKK